MRCMTSNGICRGFAFKYGKFPLPLRYRTALSVPKVPTRVQKKLLLLQKQLPDSNTDRKYCNALF